MKNTITACLVLALTLLSGAIAWLAYSIQGVTRELPAVMSRVDDVNARVDAIVETIPLVVEALPPIVEEVGRVRETVPPIIDEVGKVRETIPGILDEMKEIRETIPPLLARVEDVQKQIREIEEMLPMIAETLDTASAAVNHAADEVAATRPLVEKVINESETIRREVPDTLDRVERIVADAKTIGSKASQGAVTGVVKGIITSPFQLIKDAGKSIAGTLFTTGEVTAEDERRVVEATSLLLGNLELNAVNWSNTKSGNRGRITIKDAYTKDGISCVVLQFDLSLKSGKTESSLEEACLTEDGSWQMRE